MHKVRTTQANIPPVGSERGERTEPGQDGEVACYVDRLVDYSGRVTYRHKIWCHLVADTDDELVACAAELGISEAWLQGTRGWDQHFDLPAPIRPGAVDLGAIEVDFRFMGRRTRARRAALALGADVAVGAPEGAVIEVPLAPGRWEAAASPPGVTATWADGHPLLGDCPVVRLASDRPVTGVVALRRDGGAERVDVVRIGIVVGAALPPRVTSAGG